MVQIVRGSVRLWGKWMTCRTSGWGVGSLGVVEGKRCLPQNTKMSP